MDKLDKNKDVNLTLDELKDLQSLLAYRIDSIEFTLFSMDNLGKLSLQEEADKERLRDKMLSYQDIRRKIKKARNQLEK